jgi:brefeldin A-inhibited guanine nucleotide-exchange protein
MGMSMRSKVREMAPKNIECIRVLITIALTDGDYLEEAWFAVLECISQVSMLSFFGSVTS